VQAGQAGQAADSASGDFARHIVPNLLREFPHLLGLRHEVVYPAESTRGEPPAVGATGAGSLAPNLRDQLPGCIFRG